MSAGNTPDDNQTAVFQQATGGSGCFKAMGVVTLIMLAAILLLGAFAWDKVGGFFGGIGQGLANIGDTISGLPESVSDAVEEAFQTETHASIDTKNLLVNSIVHLGTLVTASQQIDTDVQVGVRSGLLNICGASVKHDVEGTIEAGVDLSQIQASDFTHDIFSNSWVLKLGSAIVHSCRIDYIRQDGHSLSLCRQNWDEYRLLAETAVLPVLRNEALAEGLLARAEKEAELVLGNFLSAVTGGESVTLVFESEPVTIFPESCLREPPTGWTFDEESDSWLKQ